MEETKILLHDDEAEKYVVGGLLTNAELYYSVADRLKPMLFSNPKLARTVRVIIELFKNGEVADIISVNNYLMQHQDFNNPEPWEVAEYSSFCITGNFQQHFAIVEDLYTRRRYSELGAKLMKFGTDPTTTYEEMQKEISLVMDEGAEKRKRVKSLRDANKELKKRVMDNYNGTSDTMIPTGFKEVDERGGLQTGDFDVIAAESSQGKTSLLMSIAEYAAQRGVPSMIFSMEMQSDQIAARLVSPKAKISSGVIQYKKLDDWQLNELSQAIKKTDDLPIYFDDDSTISFDSIVASIRNNVKRLGIKLVGIDYLQILATTGHNSNTEQYLGAIARKCKNLAKELNICIVALSQLARNTLDPKPTLSRVRASGQIVEAADTVAMIWRPSEYGKSYSDFVVDDVSKTAELIFGKGRNIGTFNCIVGFDKPTTHFYEYDGEVKRYGEIHIKGKKNKDKEEDKEEAKPFAEPEQGALPF